MASSSSYCSSSLPSYATIRPSFRRQTRQAVQVRAQSFHDEGRSSSNNIVDANLSVLRKRVEQVKIRDRLERCCRCELYGWNYAPGYNYKLKRDAERSEFLELVTLVGRTLGFTFFSGTIFLCLVSLFVHLNQ